MDWDGIRTALIDRERVRLGLPSRMEVEAARAKQAQAAAESASGLESKALERVKTQAEIEAMPGERDQRSRLVEAQIANYNEPNRADHTGSWAVTPDGKHRINNMTGEVVPVGIEGGVGRATSGGSNEPRTGWQPLFDEATGKLQGYYHPATGTMRNVGEGGIPAGVRPGAMTAGERDSLALGSVPIRAGDTMRKALAATRTAEKESPFDPATWTGPVAGRVGGAYRGFVDTSGPAGDFEQARREGRALVYALSGKQINEQEQAWLDQILSRLSDRGVEQQLERYDRFVNYLRTAKAKRYADPFAVAQAQVDTELPSADGGEQPAAMVAPAAAAPPRPAGVPPDAQWDPATRRWRR